MSDYKIAIFCVGNRLMLDDGVGPAVYDALIDKGQLPEEVSLYDIGCLTMGMVQVVNEYDYLITVDAVDGTGQPAGAVVKFDPYDLAGHAGPTASLHELKLRDLFDAAALLGYKAEGLCLGVQVENASPSHAVEGLTPSVAQAVPLLADVVVGEVKRILSENSEQE